MAELIPLLVADPSHPCAIKKRQGASNVKDDQGRADGLARQLMRLALRIAENRVVAGVHYPADTLAGHALGTMLARVLVWLASDSDPGKTLDWSELKLGAQAFADPGTVDADKAQPKLNGFVDEQPSNISGFNTLLTDWERPDLPVLKALWTLARREWVGDPAP